MNSVSLKDLGKISKSIPDIEELGLNLDFNNIEVDAWRRENEKEDDEQYGTFQMLRSWFEKDGSSVTKLIEALRESNMGELANDIQKDKLEENNQGQGGASNVQRAQPAQPAQPGNDGGIDDESLRKLGKCLFTGVDKLATALGVKYVDQKRYKAINYRTEEVTADGTVQMLFDWRERIPPPEQRTTLGQALVEAQLLRVKEEFNL